MVKSNASIAFSACDTLICKKKKQQGRFGYLIEIKIWKLGSFQYIKKEKQKKNQHTNFTSDISMLS